LWLPVDAYGGNTHGQAMVADLPDYGRLAWSVCGSQVSTSGATFMASLDAPFVMRVAYDPQGGDSLAPQRGTRVPDFRQWKREWPEAVIPGGEAPLRVRLGDE